MKLPSQKIARASLINEVCGYMLIHGELILSGKSCGKKFQRWM
jgi:hypothetical protein